MTNSRTRELVEQASSQIRALSIDPCEDISRERQRASIDVKQLACHLNGGQKKLDQKYALLMDRNLGLK